MANNAVGFLALFIALGGVGYAAGGGFSSGGTLRACANEEGAIRLLKPGKRCHRGQTAVAWNQTGPAGAKGAAGAVGAAGAAGAPGAQGPVGREGSSGVSTNTKWAALNDSAELEAGVGVEATETPSVGTYRVRFDRSLQGCAIVATQNSNTANFVVGQAHLRTDPSEVEMTVSDFGTVRHAAPVSVIVAC